MKRRRRPTTKESIVDYSSVDAISMERFGENQCTEIGCNNSVSKKDSDITGGRCMNCYMDTAGEFGFGV